MNGTHLCAIVLTVGVVALEGAVTWLGPDWAGLVLNVLLVLILMVGAHRRDMTWAQIGISGGATVNSLRWGAILAVLGLIFVSVAAGMRPSLFAAVESPQSMGGLVLVVLRILILTALAEELIFRGVLLAVWQRALPITGIGPRRFLAWLSPSFLTGLFFGLWHIGPTRDMLARSGDPVVLAAFAGPVLATALAGVFVLGPLREWTGGIAGGVLVHSVMNSSVVVAAYLQAN